MAVGVRASPYRRFGPEQVEVKRVALRVSGLRRQVELDRQTDMSHHCGRLSRGGLGGLDAVVGGHQLHVGDVDDTIVVSVRRQAIARLAAACANEAGHQSGVRAVDVAVLVARPRQ